MGNHLESKTMVGLGTLLLCIVALAVIGKLTSEAVDALKWLGGSFFAVRTAANIAEKLPATPKKDG